ncbi:hypothetical protein LTR95_001915, partial [Oleoguttula sp. CCFEE 5521]
SGVVETYYATILNYTYSINGKRALTVFRTAVRCLNWDDESPVSFEPVVVVLTEIFEVVPSAQVNDDLRALAEAISALADKRELSGRPHTQHIRLRRRLGLGAAIEQVSTKTYSREVPLKPSFVVAHDQPGSLSTLGTRHDNDSEDIEDIQILPTWGEIVSDRSEYLPQDDPSLWHKSGVQGLLDRQFRLIREDTVGQLRDAIQTGLQRLQQPQLLPVKPRNSTHTNTYHDVHLAAVEFDTNKGLLCVLAFEHPRAIRDASNKKRQEWWAESRRLEHDALLGLVGSDGTVVFVTVHAPIVSQSWRNGKEDKRPNEKYSRWRGHEAYVIVQLVDRANENDIEDLLHRFAHHTEGAAYHRFSLTEFPKILLAAFKPTLEALRQTAQSGILPFSALIAPEPGTPPARVGLPAYARTVDYRFDLSILSNNDDEIEFDPHKPMTAEELTSKTHLDHGQAHAMVASLTNELALVQGPPGTGKSYTGLALTKTLLANRAAADMGPIVTVTYTNHALDQTLEHLVEAGVEQIIRIGGQSKSESLAPINIRVIADRYPPTKAERLSRKTTSAEMQDLTPMITAALEHYSRSLTIEGVVAYLKEHYAAYHSQLCPDLVDQEGFQVVSHHQKGVHAWLTGTARGTYDSEDPFTWDQAQRQSTFKEWSDECSMEAKIDLLANMQAYDVVKTKHDQTKGEITLRALNDAHIIGVTTTGLAQNLHILKRLNAKVLIVEEAGEVLEAHLLTALLPSIEHAILIGDHKQLRPKVADYAFDCENPNPIVKLNVSLLERLILPQQADVPPLPHTTLDVQRRMHPSIARLVRETVYPDLHDDSSVERYPEVSGMRRRLFWLEHSELEDGQQLAGTASALPGTPVTAGPEAATEVAADSTTHTNEHEVNMVLALVRHLIRQGVYRPDDIAVLTPYVGQLRKIRKELAKFTEVVLSDVDEDALQRDGEDDGDNFEAPPRSAVAKSTLLKAVRLATVDNFQGEEAKVVIISLVRSNFMRRPGFLSQPNRANVLLSRAKHGMLIIGNPETFAGSQIWRDVIHMLDEEGNVGPAFELCCPRHPDTVLTVTMPDDFVIVSPEAGCNAICGKELPLHEPLSALEMQHALRRSVRLDPVLEEMREEAEVWAPLSITLWRSMSVRESVSDMHDRRDQEYARRPAEYDKSLDSVMGMAAYYELDGESGMPIALNADSVPFSVAKVPGCPDCHSSLHSMSRYGRITRRVQLDKSVKQLIVLSDQSAHELTDALQEAQATLVDTREDASLGQDDILLLGGGDGRFKLLKCLKSTRRYHDLAEVREQAREFLIKVSKDELPYERVFNMVDSVRRKRVLSSSFVNGSKADGTILQTRGELLASALVLRCDIIAMTDLVSVWSNDKTRSLYVNFAADRRACENFVELAQATKHPVHEVQGHIFWATFAALESQVGVLDERAISENAKQALRAVGCQVAKVDGSRKHITADQTLRDAAEDHLDRAQELCDEYPDLTSHLSDEVDDARLMVHVPDFQGSARLAAAVKGQELRSTGRWYACINGHPFAVGECEKMTNLARCPHCKEAVIGHDHVLQNGVEHDEDVEDGLA